MGGDRRGKQSAAILIVKEGAGTWGRGQVRGYQGRRLA
jgi:hypothetical protein